MSNQEYIKIEGAYENNLKHISLDIPKKQITIFTGVSGSGKSSLVLDTIAASSRRELNETFPSFVQQYLPKYGRPHVDRIGNLPVAIVIDQRKPAPNARSTVGTYTDIYSLLRLLFSRVGKPFVGYSIHSPLIIRKAVVPVVTDWGRFVSWTCISWLILINA